MKELKVWDDARGQGECRHIQMDTIVPNFEPDGRKRHFIQNVSSFSEVLCRPIFSGGIIFCNFINFYTQYFHGHTKGDILQLFLEEYEKQTGQKFSNIIFIDDKLSCVKNVKEVMEKIGMPCIGINILPYPIDSNDTDSDDSDD
jgi:hypothetical protein